MTAARIALTCCCFLLSDPHVDTQARVSQLIDTVGTLSGYRVTLKHGGSTTYISLFVFYSDFIPLLVEHITAFVSPLRAVSTSHQSTVANSVEIQNNVAFGCRLNAIYCCSTLFKWPAFFFLKAGTAVSFSLHGKPVTTTRHHLTAEDSSL